ncbi:MAG: hypothetical protein IJ788_02060 [Oscillospiraceae bacterium]|nr:hypothetical protein [Oscillospiraceae bacterium]
MTDLEFNVSPPEEVRRDEFNYAPPPKSAEKERPRRSSAKNRALVQAVSAAMAVVVVGNSLGIDYLGDFLGLAPIVSVIESTGIAVPEDIGAFFERILALCADEAGDAAIFAEMNTPIGKKAADYMDSHGVMYYSEGYLRSDFTGNASAVWTGGNGDGVQLIWFPDISDFSRVRAFGLFDALSESYDGGAYAADRLIPTSGTLISYSAVGTRTLEGAFTVIDGAAEKYSEYFDVNCIEASICCLEGAENPFDSMSVMFSSVELRPSELTEPVIEEPIVEIKPERTLTDSVKSAMDDLIAAARVIAAEGDNTNYGAFKSALDAAAEAVKSEGFAEDFQSAWYVNGELDETPSSGEAIKLYATDYISCVTYAADASALFTGTSGIIISDSESHIVFFAGALHVPSYYAQFGEPVSGVYSESFDWGEGMGENTRLVGDFVNDGEDIYLHEGTVISNSLNYYPLTAVDGSLQMGGAVSASFETPSWTTEMQFRIDYIESEYQSWAVSTGELKGDTIEENLYHSFLQRVRGFMSYVSTSKSE